MTLPFDRHFEAHLPLVATAVRITSLYDAQVFMRRWVIRDKDRNLKALLRTLEQWRADRGGDGRIQADAGGARSFGKASRLNAASSIRGLWIKLARSNTGIGGQVHQVSVRVALCCPL